MQKRALLDLLTDMTRLHSTYVDRRLSRWGLHSGQGSILSALRMLGPCSQKELADFRQVSPATISVMLGRMEHKGLIIRVPSGEGGKRNQISLSPTGQVLIDEIASNMPDEDQQIFLGLTDEDKEHALHIFEVISENLARLSR